MRLLKLDVAHFGPVRKASLELGPGLNVIYGPNDLGKSSLAEAIRAVLLLQPSSTEHRAYVPWGTDLTPEVELTFQVDDDARWRVRKAFGSGSKHSAVLERAKPTGDFHSEATAREVDGRVRTLLQWGVQPPGGKGAPKGLPETYLSRLLLGRQSDVLAIFEKSLEQDFDESGKKRITLALQAFAQPELFRKILQRTQEKVDLAYESRGNPRRGKGSPFVAIRDEVKGAEQRLATIQEQLRGSEGVRGQLGELVARRDELAMRVEEAKRRSARVREAWSRSLAVSAAQQRLEQARKELQAIQAAHEAVARREDEVAAGRSAVASAEASLATALTEVEVAERALRAAEEQLRTVTAERADALLLQKQTLQTRRAELEAARDDASRRLEAAKAAGALVADADARERELTELEAEVERLRAALARADVELRLDGARLEAARARGLVDALTTAEGQLVARRQALDVAAKGLADAAAALDRAEEGHQQARDQLQRVQSESGAQQRALKEEELGRRTLQAEADLRAAETEAERANAVKAQAARVADLERELDASRAKEAETRAAAATAEVALADAQAQLELLRVIAAYLEWRALVAQRDEARLAADRAAQLRAEAADVLGQAERVEAELAAVPLPAPALLTAFRGLERDLGVAEAKVAVGLTVTILPRQAFELRAASDGEVPESAPAVAGEEIVCEAKRQLHLVLGDLADVTVTGGQEQDHQLARDLRARWAAEVEPLLRAVGVGDVAGLDDVCRRATERQGEAAALRQRAAHLDAQAAAGGAAERLDQATRLAGEREVALAGHELKALELEATRLGLLAPAGPLFSSSAPRSPAAVLEAHRKDLEARLARARGDLEARRVDLGQRSVRVETHATELEQARAGHAAASAALGAPVEAVLLTSAATLTRARADLASIATERAGLARELNTALADAQRQVDQAVAQREAARRARDARQEEREAAQADVTTLEGQLDLRRQAARSVDAPALEARVATLEAELAATPAAAKQPATRPAPTEADLERQRANVDETRAALSAAQADAAARRATRDGAVAARDAKLRETGDDWQALLATARAQLARARTDLATTQGELAALDQHRDAAIEAARAQLGTTTSAHQQALVVQRGRAEARDAAKSALDTCAGQLEVLRQQADALDRAAAEEKVAAATAERSALPAPDPTLPHDAGALQSAEAAVTDAERLLGQVNQDLTRAQAQLELLGGSVIQERANDAKDAVDRLVAREHDVELEFAAWRLLKETLEEAEAQQTTHLGQALVGPVTQRFRELTAGRYGALSLGPNLETHGITATGEVRDVHSLSAGTRDQLSTLLRLTVAAQLQSVLVLDDQLAQSDPKRLKWFADVLRESGKTTQIVVFTCRPEDYLLADEFPSQASSVRDVTAFARVIDLQRVVTRAAGIPA